MLLSFICGSLCGDTDLEGLRSAGSDCHRLAAETVELSVSTKTKCQNVIDFAQDVKATLTGIGPKLAPSTYTTIMEYHDKMTETMTLAREMDDMAQECVNKSSEMTQAMQRGVDSLPKATKSEMEDDKDSEDENDVKLLDVDKDIEELEKCTSSLQNTNLFSAASSGTRAFQGLANKGELCKTMFERVEELSASIARITQAFMQQSCCAQMTAVLSEAKNMLRCIRLSTLMQKIAEAARRLIQAIFNLLNMAWSKFKDFLDEFEAAKKIKNFVNSINPLEKGSMFNRSGVVEKGSTFSRSRGVDNTGVGKEVAPAPNIICCGLGS
jgi:phage-related protein